MARKLEYYTGVILPDPDPKDMGRYKVHCDELHLRISPSDGQWCRNHVVQFRHGMDKQGHFSGQYMPLQAGMVVSVAISSKDYNNANIVQILSDSDIGVQKSVMPFNVQDRDDLYLLLRTAKYDTIISVTEDTKNEPARTLHVYHNGTKIILDSNGIHITTQNQSVSISGASNIAVGGDCNLQVGGTTNLKSAGPIHMDGPTINLNSGTSVGNSGYNTFPATKELVMEN